MKLALKKETIDGKTGLFPFDDRTEEKTGKLPPGEFFECEIKQNRNLLHHNKFIKILRITVENSEKFNTVNHLLETIKFTLGYYDIKKDFHGNTFIVLKSISFGKMDQTEFNKFYKNGVSLCAEHLEISPEILEEQTYDNH